MADMLMADGHVVHVWARRPEIVSQFKARGAIGHSSPAEVGAAVRLVCLCVTADVDVLEIAEGGLLAAMPAGSVLAVHSTVSPEVCLRLQTRARDVDLIDAPVSGSSLAARERRLLMMIGGNAGAAALVRQAFSGFCIPILHMGPLGSALRAKFINNTLMAANLELARQALAAGEQWGLDRTKLQQALAAGVARSFSMEAILRLEDAERARHLAPLMAKDLILAQQAAQASGLDLQTLVELAQAGQAHLARRAEHGR